MKTHTTGKTQSSFYPDPGTYDEVTCGVCGTVMEVARDVRMPRGFAAALSRSSDPCDHFKCPHKSSDWHSQVVLIRRLAAQTPSKRLEVMFEQECQAILGNRTATVDLDSKGLCNSA